MKGKEYQELIKQKGLKQDWVAKEIGVHFVSLSIYLNEKKEMPVSVQKKLKKLLKC